MHADTRTYGRGITAIYAIIKKCTPSVLTLSVGLALVLIKGTSKPLSQSGFVHAAPTAVHDRFNTVKYYEN